MHPTPHPFDESYGILGSYHIVKQGRLGKVQASLHKYTDRQSRLCSYVQIIDGDKDSDYNETYKFLKQQILFL